MSWVLMNSRCNNPKNPKYPRYGGRGIKVCERWFRFASFLDDMGERPPGCTIDREDNDKGYEPGNCRWLPRGENTSRAMRGRRLSAEHRWKLGARFRERTGDSAGGP
jgi:hypothetical protein